MSAADDPDLLAKYEAAVAALAFDIAQLDPSICHGLNDESSSERGDLCDQLWHEMGDQAEAVMTDIFDHPYLADAWVTEGEMTT